tara:strand:- start:1048 stop:1443 length:396 start_codon:yes stop_codon:yes gene_type:complete
MNNFYKKSLKLLNKYDNNWINYINDKKLLYIKNNYLKFFVSSEQNCNILLIKWNALSKSNIHGHHSYGCHFKLLEGELIEKIYKNNIYNNEKYLIKNYNNFINNNIGNHQIINYSNKPAISLHVYPFHKKL